MMKIDNSERMNCSLLKRKNILVADLDGTIWKENSHVAIVEQFLERKKYTSTWGRCITKLFFKHRIEELNKDFADVPQSFVEEFSPHYREEILRLLRAYSNSNYEVIIISNAPSRIIDYAYRHIGFKCYNAPVNRKLDILREYYPSWDELVIITDNITDKDVIEVSNKAFLVVNNKTRKKFMRFNLPSNVQYIDC